MSAPESPLARDRNWLPAAGLAACLAGLFGYPTVFVRFPATRDVPWASWLLFALGLGLLGRGIARAYRRPERWRGRVLAPALGAVGVAALVLFLLMTEVWSRRLPPAAAAPRAGERAPDFVLPDALGRTVSLSALLASDPSGAPGRGSWVLLIFYRGHW